MNYPKKTRFFNLYQSHCANIAYIAKTWFLKILSLSENVLDMNCNGNGIVESKTVFPFVGH